MAYEFGKGEYVGSPTCGLCGKDCMTRNGKDSGVCVSCLPRFREAIGRWIDAKVARENKQGMELK